MDSRPRYSLPLTSPGQPHTPAPTFEARGLWISRFDWTVGGGAADPAKIDEIVDRSAGAGFNMLFFQVRGIADTYYFSELEPWADRVSGGVLGQVPEPFWDPLAYLIERAHGTGLQVHAYMNVYPLAEGGQQCNLFPPVNISPTPPYYHFLSMHGAEDGKPNVLQWDEKGNVICGSYRYGSPASRALEDHLLRVASELALYYAIDGIHLDHVRYAARQASFDPVSLRRYYNLPDDAPLPSHAIDEAYADWQRQLISDTVRRIYNEVTAPTDNLWLTAAVWPIHRNKPEFNLPAHPRQGYSDYYQDSKAWAQGGYIDALLPMIYPGTYHCPDNSYWTQDIWRTLVADFQAERGDRFILPGIGAGYCTFDEIPGRIDTARSLGAAGHTLFSYRGLLEKGYFDALAAGPYATSAQVPTRPWRG